MGHFQHIRNAFHVLVDTIIASWRTEARTLLLKSPEFSLYAFVFLFPILVRCC